MSLQLRHLDLEAGTIRLDPGMTKTDDGRVLYLTPELTRMLKVHVERVRALMQRTNSIIPDLFPHLAGRHQETPRRMGEKSPGSPVSALDHTVRSM